MSDSLLVENDISISSLSFGKAEAEHERIALNQYWISTPTYLNAKNDKLRKTFYVGQRGSGKSALFNRLCYEYKQCDKNIVLSLTPDEFSYEIFRKLEHDKYDMKSVYGTVWHYTLLVRSFHAVIDFFSTYSNIKRHKEDLNVIKSFLKDQENMDSSSPTQTFFTFLNRFRAMKVGNNQIDSTNSNEIDQRNGIISTFRMNDMNRPIQAFKRIISNYPIYIFIDELDTGFDNSEEAKIFIYGLFYAVSKLRNPPEINIFISLRQDMYNCLPSIYTNAEKLRDEIEIIRWSKQNLVALIGYRILSFLPDRMRANLNFKSAIDILFEPDVLEFVIERTLYRPREIIQACNDCLDVFKNAPFHGLSHNGKINLEIAKQAIQKFSSYKISDLSEEYSTEYPRIIDFFKLFANHNEFYNYSEFKSLVEENLLLFIDKTDDLLIDKYYPKEMDQFVHLLYDIGFIKVFNPISNKYVAYYELASTYINNFEKLKIHGAFSSVLQLNNNI